MARPRKLPLDDLIQQAMEIFWRRGYGATSLSDLEAELGIGRRSLYNSFGDKRGLFLAALDRFLEAPIPVTLPDAGISEIRQTFLRAPFLHPGFRACLMANTILELGQTDPEIAARTQQHLRRLRLGFEGALGRAAEAGEIPALDVPDAARFLTSSMQGLAVMARGGTSDDELRRIAAYTLRSIGA